MKHFESHNRQSLRPLRKICLLSGTLLIFWVAGCGGNTTSKTTSPSQPAPQTYFAPLVAGSSYPSGGNTGVSLLYAPQTYTIDDTANTFSQATYQINPFQQVINAGVFSTSTRGLLSLGTKESYELIGAGDFLPVTLTPPQAGSFAVQLAGQAGGLVQLLGQPVVPLVAATQCPDLATPVSYQFVTIPAALISPTAAQQLFTWDPITDTAYGSVDISSSGSTVTFNKVHQFTLPSVGGTGAPAQPAASYATGACAQTPYGNTISLPNPPIITDPGTSGSSPRSATVGIGPTGLLVEDSAAPAANAGLYYQNALGAGTGAVGLPKPSSPLDTTSIVGKQYLGFIYGAGKNPGNGSSPTGWSSHLASFGFSSVPSSCSSVADSTSTLIYGGDFPQANGQDNPSASPDGFGNCDFAIDLGSQDSSTNGLYKHATVWIGANYAANTSGANDPPFSAVAIAGQLNGKYAIFLIGVDSSQPWAIYLLQSSN